MRQLVNILLLRSIAIAWKWTTVVVVIGTISVVNSTTIIGLRRRNWILLLFILILWDWLILLFRIRKRHLLSILKVNIRSNIICIFSNLLLFILLLITVFLLTLSLYHLGLLILILLILIYHLLIWNLSLKILVIIHIWINNTLHLKV